MLLHIGSSDALAIVLAVAGIVLGAVIPPAVKMVQRKAVLRQLSYVFPALSQDNEWPIIHIRASFDEIPFGTNPPTMRGYTHSGDVQAVTEIHKKFEKLPVKLQFDYFPEISSFMKNVVIIGASSRSDTSRELGQELYDKGVRVHGEGRHAFLRDASGVEYACEHRQQGEQWFVTRDAGIIYRKVTDVGAIILLCGGIHTFGSQAAAEVALLPDFQDRVRKSGLKQFLQFVTVDVISSGDHAGLGIIRQSIRWRDLPLQPI